MWGIVSCGLKDHLSSLPDNAEIVYVVRDQRTGEVLSVGKSSKGPDSVNLTTRTQKYMRQEEFLRTNGHADVELVLDYAVVKPSSVKALQQRGIQVETGIEAPPCSPF